MGSHVSASGLGKSSQEVTIAPDQEVSLSSSTIDAIQAAMEAANEPVTTDLQTIADILNDVLVELMTKLEAGEDVGLTEDAITALATAIATLFHYPTDYPDAGANSKLTDVKTKLDTIAGYVDGLEALVTSTNTKLDTNHTDLTHLTDNTQTTKITNGTQSADTVAGDSGQNALLQAGIRKEVSFSTTTVQAVGTTDVSNFSWVSVQITSQGSGSSIAFQGSNDNSTWVSATLQTPVSTGGSSTASVTGLYSGPLLYRYFRLNVSGISAGTTAGVIEFLSQPRSVLGSNISVSQTTSPWVTTDRGSTNTVTSVAGSASSVTILSSNTTRKEAIIVNDSSAVLYVKFGTTASSTDYTYQLQAGDTLIEDKYTNRIDGVWSAAVGSARVTEITT